LQRAVMLLNCAWILWSLTGSQAAVISAHRSDVDCEWSAREVKPDTGFWAEWYKLWGVKTRLLCLPDTIDPRQPK
jgi:hypothetical protein